MLWKSFRGDKALDTYWQQVYAIADKIEDSWRRLFGDYKRVLQQTPISAVEEAVRTGGVGLLNAKIPYEAAVSALTEGARATYGKVVVRAATESAKQIVRKDDIGFELSFTLDNPFVAGVIATAVGATIRQVDNETRLGIQQVILRAFQNGDPPSVVARKIRDMIGLTGRDATAVYNYYRELVKEGLSKDTIDKLVDKYTDKKLRERAMRIARTEMNSAANAGTQASWQEADRQGLLFPWAKREWIAAVEDPRTCPICRELDGKRVGLNEPFVASGRAIMMPPEHVNCLLPGTKVVAPNLIAAYKRWFEGTVVTLRTASGDEITVTANHPILTPGGWVPASAIAEGSDIIGTSDSDAVARFLDPHNKHVPTAIEQVADSLKMAHGMVSSTMPTATEDFHGDGSNGEVEVIHSGLFLLDKGDTSFRKQARQLQFVGRDVALQQFAPRSMSDLTFLRERLSADGIVRSSSQLQSLVLSHALHSDYVRFGASTGRNSGISEYQTDRSACDTVSFGQSKYRITSAVPLAQLLCETSVLSNSFTLPMFTEEFAPFFSAARALKHSQLIKDIVDPGDSDSKLFAKLSGLLSSKIRSTNVVSVRRYWHRTHVYNLQTVQGWFVANGIITHNCRCTLGLWTDIPK